MGALISFLGGSAFRMVWGEFSAYFTRKQEHTHEMERMKLQGSLDAEQHARNLDAIRVQASLGVQAIPVRADSSTDQFDANIWVQTVADISKQTGIKFIDYWNGAIRPWLATMASAVVLFEIIRNGFVLTDWDRELVGAILGIYVADRQLSKRGK